MIPKKSLSKPTLTEIAEDRSQPEHFIFGSFDFSLKENASGLCWSVLKAPDFLQHLLALYRCSLLLERAASIFGLKAERFLHQEGKRMAHTSQENLFFLQVNCNNAGKVPIDVTWLESTILSKEV